MYKDFNQCFYADKDIGDLKTLLLETEQIKSPA